MDLPTARATLGLGPRPTWDEVRAAYRARIRVAHPDRAGGTNEAAATLNAAYAAMLEARRTGRLTAGAPEPASAASRRRPARPHTPAEPAGPVEVLDGDTIHIPLPPDEALAHLLRAAHEVGEVTYVDRSCAIFEVLVSVAGEGACSLVVTLHGRADGTDAFCTLEAIQHVASPPVHHVAAALAAAL